jgi:hypothetical protein
MLRKLLKGMPDAVRRCHYHPELGSLKRYLGRCVYLEALWPGECPERDDNLTRPVRELFEPESLPLAKHCRRVPTTDQFLNRTTEIQEEHLLRLANPRRLPDHPLVQNHRLQTRPVLRRLSCRGHEQPDQDCAFAGLRLVPPPA